MNTDRGQFVTTFESIDQLAEANRLDLDFRQLEAGQGAIRATTTTLASLVRIDYEFDRAFHQRGKMPNEVFTFGFMRGASRSRWGGTDIGPETLLDFNSRNGFETRSYNAFSCSMLMVNQDDLLQAGEAIGIDLSTLGTREVAAPLFINPSRFTRLQSILQLADSFVESTRESSISMPALAELEAEFYCTLARCLEQAPSVATAGTRLSRLKCLRRAIDYIDAHLQEPITVPVLCRASYASSRTLVRVFQEELGVSPKRYIQLARLAGVRQELSRVGSDASIRNVALSWGFWNMSQLAQDYRREFGELPSGTKNR